MTVQRLYRNKTHEWVPLPAEMLTFRGEPVTVVDCYCAHGGSSGRVVLDNGRAFFPGVVGCYIASEPRTVKL